jgi:hypothetical protein
MRHVSESIVAFPCAPVYPFVDCSVLCVLASVLGGWGAGGGGRGVRFDDAKQGDGDCNQPAGAAALHGGACTSMVGDGDERPTALP